MDKIKLLLYCTKQPLYLVRNESDGYFYTMDKGTLNDYKNVETYNGKVVAECDYEAEEIKEYHNAFWEDDDKYSFYETTGKNKLWEDELLKYSCLSYDELDTYLQGKNGYAIFVKTLHIFDKPKELKNYKIKKEFLGGKQVFWKELKNPPQNMMYCYGRNTGEKYVLISIRPEWACKILNGEKTIEVRKKILKEMMSSG